MQTNNPPHFVKHWKDWFYQKRKNAALQLQHSDLAGLFPVHAVLERKDICFPSNFKKKEGKQMRLDKYLKVTRLIKRRTVANEACDAGRVLVNGKSSKASLNVKEGDVIEIEFGTRTVKVEVLDVQETVRKDEAKELYKYL